jgi:hypothetical protein
MKKKLIVITILVLISVGCNLAVGDLFGPSDSSVDNDFPEDQEYSQELTATFYAVETLITEATQTAQAKQNTLPAQENQEADDDQFCVIYREFVDVLHAHVEHYEEVLKEKGDAHSIAVEADQSIEVYMDRLVPHAPDEIQSQVEMLATMSLIGLLSSNEGVPGAEPLLNEVDNYAAEHCGVSLNE